MVNKTKTFRKLSISSNKNIALKNISGVLFNITDVIDIRKLDTGLYNTKLIIKRRSTNLIDEGTPFKTTQRVILYNRVNIEKIIPNGFKPMGTINEIVHELNTKYRCDFTVDELVYNDNVLEAKPNSLGYYGSKYFIPVVNNLKYLNEVDMSKVKLTWTGTITGTAFTQEIEKKIDDGGWAVVPLTMEETTPGSGEYSAEDTDITYAADTNVTYRIVTVSGAIRLAGNETIVSVPAMPTAVSNLNAVIENS